MIFSRRRDAFAWHFLRDPNCQFVHDNLIPISFNGHRLIQDAIWQIPVEANLNLALLSLYLICLLLSAKQENFYAFKVTGSL